MENEKKDKRKAGGFAAMDRELVKKIASKGGVSAHEMGKAHEFTSEEARKAGRLGGRASHQKRRERESQRRDTVPDMSTMVAARAHQDAK